jgi:hypothetical protein
MNDNKSVFHFWRLARTMHSTGRRSLPAQLPDSTSAVSHPLKFERTTMSSNRIPDKRPTAALLGLAFDASDGHRRITRGANFLLAGGSEETHLLMRNTILKVNEQLDELGLELADVSADELRDMLNDART